RISSLLPLSVFISRPPPYSPLFPLHPPLPFSPRPGPGPGEARRYPPAPDAQRRDRWPLPAVVRRGRHLDVGGGRGGGAGARDRAAARAACEPPAHRGRAGRPPVSRCPG